MSAQFALDLRWAGRSQ